MFSISTKINTEMFQNTKLKLFLMLATNINGEVAVQSKKKNNFVLNK